jgi:hypothetical protein
VGNVTGFRALLGGLAGGASFVVRCNRVSHFIQA